MIKVERGKKPDYLQSDIVYIAIEKLDEFYSYKNRSQKRYHFPFNKEIDNELKKYLHEIFHGKCGYCEIGIETPTQGTVDRYRPHNGVRDNKEYYQDLYWWLTFEWDNLVYCCKECNQYKANYFPIKGKRAIHKNDDLTKEERLLLNPYEDNPEEHFYYNHEGFILAKTYEAEQTIELLRLNDRTSLIESRKKAKREIIDLLEKVVQKGINAISVAEKNYIHSIYNEDSQNSFLAYKKWVLFNELGETPFLEGILILGDFNHKTNLIKDFELYQSKKDKKKKDLISSDYFPIEYIHIKNFKSIDNLRIEFKDDDLDKKSWLFLLGENGVGKSTILQAIAIGLSTDKNTLIPLIDSLIKKRKQKAEIEIKERNSNNAIRTILTRKDKTIDQTGKFSSSLIGYGSLRLSVDEAESLTKKNINKVSYENLFKPIRPLNDITQWLKSIYKTNSKLFDRIAYSIKQLLPHDFPDNEITIQDGEIMFKNSEKLFSELSDGFKSTIILAVDIMMKLSDGNSDMDKMTGVVLIDELGNQLHPRWQMRIVKQLRAVFPNINFIVSTHHPLCLRGTEGNEILLLKNIKNEVVAIKELPDPSILRVDQILASEFFGLSSLVDPEIEAQFNRYYELLAKNENATLQEREEIDLLKDLLRNKQQMGGSLREELMYTVIDKLLAQEIAYNKSPLSRAELKEETIRRVKEVWRTLNLDSND
ncbi:hypothetical protein EZS27_009570 [termite gut metagenome]|uniref:ATPase AAA-type core domain-containing protein n=1 Tax=termite gut metagenome TaxID=433724 RepID=A0A5J4S9Y2_9ZZZZ